MELFLKMLRLQWWLYTIIVVAVFSIVLFLNYIVKKINEARFEERLARVQNMSKASNSSNQSVQFQRRADTKMPARVPLEIVPEQSNPPTVTGVSLVFNKDEKTDYRNKDKIDIMNFPNPIPVLKTDGTNGNSAENDVTENPSDNDIPPSYLGKIYKELSTVERSKSMSNAEKNNNKDDIDNVLLDFKKPESKSDPSVKKLLDNQNKEDLNKLPMKLVGQENLPDVKPISSSDNLCSSVLTKK